MIRIKGTRFSIDRRGVFTGSCTYLTTTLVEATQADLPNPFGVATLVGRSGGEWDAGEDAWVVTGNFEGLVFESSAADEGYDLDAEFSEEPIESHPAISQILRDYQGTKDEEGRVQFPETLAARAGSGTGLSNTRRSSNKNPFYGVTSYPAMRMIAAHTYTRRSVPSSVYKRVGEVLTSLPAGFDEPGGRKWIVMPPLARRRGDAWEITERYKDIGDEPHIELLSKLVVKS